MESDFSALTMETTGFPKMLVSHLPNHTASHPRRP